MQQGTWFWQTAFGVLLALGGLNLAAPQMAAACSCGPIGELLYPIDGGTMPADGFILASTSPIGLTLVDPAGDYVPTSAEDYGVRSGACKPYLAVLRPHQALEPGTGYRLLVGGDGPFQEELEFDVLPATPPTQAVPTLETSWAKNNYSAYHDNNSCGGGYVNAQSYDLEVTVHNPASEPALLRVESYTACGEPRPNLATLVEPGIDRLSVPYYGHAFRDGIDPKGLASGCVRMRLSDVFGRLLASSLSCPPSGASEAERGDCPDYVAPRPPALDGGLVEGLDAGAMMDTPLSPNVDAQVLPDAGRFPSDVDAAVPPITANSMDASVVPSSPLDSPGLQEPDATAPPAPGFGCAVPGRTPAGSDMPGALVLLGMLAGWVRSRSARPRR